MLLFIGVFLFSGLSPVGTSFDSRWTVYQAVSLWRHGNLTLDDYVPLLENSEFYGVYCVDDRGRISRRLECSGHWYSAYPIGGPVLTAPLVLAEIGILRAFSPIFRSLHPTDPTLNGFLRGDFSAGHALIEMEAASFLLAATAVMVYAVARRFLPSRRAVWLAILFAAATPAYSVAGRGLWQHTPSMLLLSIVIYLLIKAEDRPILAAWAGLPVALSYTVRPTGSLFVLTFTTYVALRFRSYFIRYLVAAAPVAVAFLAVNLSIYHRFLSPYYRQQPEFDRPHYWSEFGKAVAGNLISPGRGLLVYTPVFGFAIACMLWSKWKPPLATWLAGLAGLHWLVISSFVSFWWGGMCYGSRFFTDLTPVLALFLIPIFADWERLGRATRVGFIALALMGLGMNLRGGWSSAVYQWSIEPNSIDQHPERNWDWSDPPFLRTPLIGRTSPSR